MQRTIRLKLKPTDAQRQALLETIVQQTACFNAVVELGWTRGVTNSVTLHQLSYRGLRESFPTLPAQLVCSSRVRAAEALKSARTRQKQGRKVSQPRAKCLPVRYDARSYRPCIEEGVFRLSTVAGRLAIPFGANPHTRSLIEQAAGFDSADLIVREGKFWLHVVVTIPAPEVQPTVEAVGVDLGLTRPAVTSQNRFFGKRRWKAIERRYFRLRRKLQAKGTRSARRHLRRMRGKVERFRRDCDHVLSKRIVQSVNPGATLVVENLTDIRQRTKQRGRPARRRMHAWSFAQLRGFLAYKAEQHGCRVVAVDPRHTSQRCSRCGFTARLNRKSQSRFVCRECGFELNADLNAARNVAWKYLASVGMPDAGGLPVNQPIVRREHQTSFEHKPLASASGR